MAVSSPRWSAPPSSFPLGSILMASTLPITVPVFDCILYPLFFRESSSCLENESDSKITTSGNH